MQILTKQKISPKGTLNVADLKALGINILKFTAPALVVFFLQMQMGVNFKEAGLVALLALYGIIADFLKKLDSGK